MKKFVALTVVFSMILVIFALVLPVGALTPSVSTNKTAYAVGEPIIVSAQSDNALGKDWIGIVPKGVTEDGTIAWEYLNQMGSNYDITKSENRNRTEMLEPYQNFPAGRYVVYLVPDDLTLVDALAQGKILASVEISIGDASPSVSTSKNVYYIGEPIIVSAQSDNESGKDWIGIVPKGITSAGTIAWDYLVDLTANYDITKSDNRNHNDTLNPYQNFPAGNYVIYLISNDLTLADALSQGGILATKEISIVSDPSAALKAPQFVTYAINDVNSGLADGTLTITLPENHGADDIYMWWADDNGILADYTRLARFKVPSGATQFTHQMTPNTLIPAKATRLLVYTYSDSVGTSEDCFEVALPNGAGYDFPSKAPLVEFQVVSDIHIGRSESAANFKKALLDITQTCPNSSGIFANGDLVDNGTNTSLWTELWNIYDSVPNAPDFFPGIGNHEYIGTNYQQGFANFINNIRMPEGYDKPNGVPYYDVWVDGYHFIFLADDEAAGCKIGTAQYDWLEARLAEKTDDRPVFIFFHQPMLNTVAGSMGYEGWWALEDDTRMREILAEHPEICFFNGHTHWILDSRNTMYGGKDEGAIFNTSSVSYLWQSYDKAGGEYQAGSEGYYVQVYKDRVLLLGRDFVNGKWVSSAQFVLNDRITGVEEEVDTAALQTLISSIERLNASDYTEESWKALSDALSAAKAALNAETQIEIDNALSVLNGKKSALVTKSDSGNETDSGNESGNADTGNATSDINVGTGDSTSSGNSIKPKKGCGSSVASLGALMVCAIGAAAVLKKRRR